MSPNTAFLTADEAADEFRLDGETVRRWARTGRINAVKLPGGQWRIRRADVEAILAGQPSTTGPVSA